MRFVCLSDAHSHRFSVPLGDVLLDSGDLSANGKVQDFEITMGENYFRFKGMWRFARLTDM